MDNGLTGPSEWQKVPMGRIGLDLLIPVLCPLVTERHFPSRLCGCQGKHHTSEESQTQPTPHKASDASRKGKAGYPLPGKEEVRKARPARFVSFPFLFPKKALILLKPAQGGHRELGTLL